MSSNCIPICHIYEFCGSCYIFKRLSATTVSFHIVTCTERGTSPQRRPWRSNRNKKRRQREKPRPKPDWWVYLKSVVSGRVTLRLLISTLPRWKWLSHLPLLVVQHASHITWAHPNTHHLCISSSTWHIACPSSPSVYLLQVAEAEARTGEVRVTAMA